MSHRPSRWIYFAPLFLLPLGVGCQKNGGDTSANGTNSSSPEGEAAGESTAGANDQSAAGEEGQRPRLLRRQRPRLRPPVEEAQAQPLEMPQVIMTQAHRETCLVVVGDAMPNAELQDLAGEPATLTDYLGDKLTVVLFWSSSNPYAVEALAELASHAAGSFGDSGVVAIAVRVGAQDDEAQRQVESAGAAVDELFDPQQTLFDQVATEGLPRIYLLDSEGSVLWFDIEHSQSTLRQLEAAILVTLGDEPSGNETGT